MGNIIWLDQEKLSRSARVFAIHYKGHTRQVFRFLLRFLTYSQSKASISKHTSRCYSTHTIDIMP